MEGTIGEIRMFAGNFAPKNWAICEGQLIAIASNTALFSILGTYYGGNGTTTFALPNLQGRTVVGAGSGPGLSPYDIGDMGGEESVVLTAQTMPIHTHSITGSIVGNVSVPVANLEADTTNPAGAAPAVPASETPIYSSSPDGTMGPMTTSATVTNVQVGTIGSQAPFSILGSGLGIYYIICMRGVFPARN